ncbi:MULTISPECIES: hypothetical protein [unclassified Neisseria]|uniref:hypothetical protein n=1 Tax=unclassified Neisseria TaxID=2623750 RepID=UPI002666F06F|nr:MULTISPECIES: hypothetical protein [unclassified Neisseria]MDO1515920.1 hypothetical protein [Neisseria sp. MVDL18-041461]MDO1563033.1 hypothetical protein [Neisseria sp. MVDL20-010259]
MLQILILLIFGKLQDSFDNYPAWKWAVGYVLLNVILSRVIDISALPVSIISSAILGLYAWGYFVLLRRVSDSLLLWLVILLVGALLPIVAAINVVQDLT